MWIVLRAKLLLSVSEEIPLDDQPSGREDDAATAGKNSRQWSDLGAYCIGCGLWVPLEVHVQHRCPRRGLDRKARAQVRRIVARMVARAVADALGAPGRER